MAKLGRARLAALLLGAALLAALSLSSDPTIAYAQEPNPTATSQPVPVVPVQPIPAPPQGRPPQAPSLLDRAKETVDGVIDAATPQIVKDARQATGLIDTVKAAIQAGWAMVTNPDQPASAGVDSIVESLGGPQAALGKFYGAEVIVPTYEEASWIEQIAKILRKLVEVLLRWVPSILALRFLVLVLLALFWGLNPREIRFLPDEFGRKMIRLVVIGFLLLAIQPAMVVIAQVFHLVAMIFLNTQSIEDFKVVIDQIILLPQENIVLAFFGLIPTLIAAVLVGLSGVWYIATWFQLRLWYVFFPVALLVGVFRPGMIRRWIADILRLHAQLTTYWIVLALVLRFLAALAPIVPTWTWIFLPLAAAIVLFTVPQILMRRLFGQIEESIVAYAIGTSSAQVPSGTPGGARSDSAAFRGGAERTDRHSWSPMGVVRSAGRRLEQAGLVTLAWEAANAGWDLYQGRQLDAERETNVQQQAQLDRLQAQVDQAAGRGQGGPGGGRGQPPQGGAPAAPAAPNRPGPGGPQGRPGTPGGAGAATAAATIAGTLGSQATNVVQPASGSTHVTVGDAVRYASRHIRDKGAAQGVKAAANALGLKNIPPTFVSAAAARAPQALGFIASPVGLTTAAVVGTGVVSTAAALYIAKQLIFRPFWRRGVRIRDVVRSGETLEQTLIRERDQAAQRRAAATVRRPQGGTNA